MPAARFRSAVLIVAATAVVAGCTSSTPAGTRGSTAPGTTAVGTASPSPSTTSPSAPVTSAPATSTSGTVWLCRPGLTPDPCTADQTTTIVSTRGARTIERAAAAGSPPVDCFYVYPTVSKQRTLNAD